MDKTSRLDPPRNSNLLIKVLIGFFVIVTTVLVFVAVILILTQKPVDLSHVVVSPKAPLHKVARPFRKYHTTPAPYRKFTFDDLFSGKIFLKDAYSIAWRENGDLVKKKDEFYQLTDGSISINPDTFEETDYINDASLQETMSSNEKYAYRSQVVRQGFRHSSEEIYRIYRIENNSAIQSAFPVGPEGDGLEIILHFSWNPNPQRNDFVFVHNYNLYYQSDPERPGTAVQLTEDGSEYLRYGVVDWLYEEEIFQSSCAVWWSKSGRYIAYMRFDDRSVNKIFVPKYDRNSQYTLYNEVPYPKAGVQNNPITRLHIWDRELNKAVIAFPPAELTSFNQSFYIFSNTWIKLASSLSELGDERLLTVWANREQNTIYVTLCSEVDCILTFTQSFFMDGKAMWAEAVDLQNIVQSTTGFFIILPHSYSDGNIYNHIAHIEIESSGTGRITSWIGAAYDVKEVKGYFASEDILTFVSAGGGVGTQKLFRCTSATKQQALVDIMSSYLDDCEYGTFELSPRGNNAVLACNRIFKNTQLWLMSVSNPQRHKILDGQDEVPLPFDVPSVTFETARLPSGYDAQIGMMRPPKFDPTRKYPVLLNLYGGPGSNRVKRITPGPNLIHYCSNYEMIIIWIDGRGTGNRGWNSKLPVYKNLGQFETLDTLDGLRYLSNKYRFIDQEKVAVYGWSYGGFLSTNVAMLDQGRSIQCAIAVAPVTDFSLYDSAYTERYMGMPAENPKGYNASRLTDRASSLRNVRYMLAHGESDDNVHYQHSALLSEALQRNMIHFKQLVYGNQDHSLGGAQRHLFKEIGLFLEECLGF